MRALRAPWFHFFAVLALVCAAAPAAAQKRCTKGKPCGNTFIAQNKTCRIGAGSATRAAPPPRALSVPEGARFVASSRGRVYYWTGCAARRGLTPANLRFFTSREDAERAGYTPSRSRGCAGPATTTIAPTTSPDPPTPSPSSPEPSPSSTTAIRLGDTRTVARVIDGDTVECREGAEPIRLLLIDAPEMAQSDYRRRSKALLETLLPAGTTAAVELDVQERDRYGRVLAYLYGADGTMVNEELVRAGYAVVTSTRRTCGTSNAYARRRPQHVKVDAGYGPAQPLNACQRIIEQAAASDRREVSIAFDNSKGDR